MCTARSTVVVPTCWLLVGWLGYRGGVVDDAGPGVQLGRSRLVVFDYVVIDNGRELV